MFVDASALVAIMALEPEERALVTRLQQHAYRVTSPIAVYEATLALARIAKASLESTRDQLADLMAGLDIQTIAITPEIGALALDAFARYGKGTRHPAQLNMGDCFAYACARAHRVPLLYKGEDFASTDLA